jgi:hypothetical protein
MVNANGHRGITPAFVRHRHRVAAAALVFVVGVALILGAELAHRHHIISTALADAGSLLAGSIALAVVYDIIVKPAQLDETLMEVNKVIWEPIRTLLDDERHEIASYVAQLSEPMGTLISNQELLFAQRVKLRIPDAGLGGFLGVIPKMDFEGAFENLEPGDEMLWLDTYCPSLRSSEDAIFDAVGRGARVQMLAIDPGAPNCAARAEEIQEAGFTESMFRNEATQGLAHIRGYASGRAKVIPRGTIEIRLYDGLPCIPMYVALRDGRPQVGYSSFFLTRATFHEPHVVWGPEPPGGFLERFVEYFRHRWLLAANESARTYLRWPT